VGARRPHLVLAVLCAAQLLVVLDITAVNVAVPAIGADLGIAAGGLHWAVSAYAVAFGVLLLPAGRLADALGRRRVFLAGVAAFGVASLACGLAPGGEVLAVSRALQGAGAAAISPAALAILAQAFGDGRPRARALAAWGTVGAVAAASGVLFGGAVVELTGWRWVFLVNVPVAAAALALGPAVLPSHRGGGRRAGALLPARMLREPATLAANLVGLLHGAMMLGSFLLLALYMQGPLGLSPVEAGAGLLAVRATSAVWAPLGARLVTALGAPALLAGGMAAMTGGLALLARAPAGGSYAADLLPGLLVLGLAIPLVFLGVNVLALRGAPPEDAGTASGLLNTSQWLGGAVGVAGVSAMGVAPGLWACAALGAAGTAVALALRASRPAPDPAPEGA
jgi:MFS family permease